MLGVPQREPTRYEWQPFRERRCLREEEVGCSSSDESHLSTVRRGRLRARRASGEL